MNNKQETFQKAVDWLNGKRKDFQEGIAILKEAGFKPAVVRKLERDGEQGPAAHERLDFQLREFTKAFGTSRVVPDTDAELHVFEGQEAHADQDEQQQLGIMAMSKKIEAEEMTVEDVNAVHVIHEYAAAYRRREKAQRLMAEVGELNDEESMTRRKEFSDEIEECTALMERLYPLFEKYQSGAEISGEEVEKAIKGSSSASSENSAATDSPATHTSDSPAGQASGELEGKSRDELLKLKKNALVRLLRTENKLLYQSEKKLEAENPMPEGAERLKLETRAASIRKDIEAIDMAIAKFG